ncbi:MAG: hypothetical protein AAB413_02825 [Patescibacteria group bacterium]
MSEEKPFYLIPVLSRPDPLPFTVQPLDDGQSSVVAGCGHTMWREERMVLGDQTVRTSNPNFSLVLARAPRWLQRFFAPKRCVLCQFKAEFDAAIQCAYCDEVIFRGDPVSIYEPADELPEGFEARATHTAGGFVGCMCMDCCPTGGFFAGHWVGNGVRSPFSAGSAAAQAFTSGDVVVSDIGPLRG